MCQYVLRPWTFWITLIHDLFVFLPHLFYKPHVWSILCAPRQDKKATYAFNQHFRRFKESLKEISRASICVPNSNDEAKLPVYELSCLWSRQNQEANILTLKRYEWPHECVGVFDTSNTFQASIEPCVIIAFVKHLQKLYHLAGHGSTLLFVVSPNQATKIFYTWVKWSHIRVESLRFLKLSSEYWYMCHSFRQHVETICDSFGEHLIINVWKYLSFVGGRGNVIMQAVSRINNMNKGALGSYNRGITRHFRNAREN